MKEDAFREERLLKGHEVAEILNCSRAKAYQLMRSRSIPTIQIGRSIRVPRRALLKWVESHTNPDVD